jgi:type IV pilus assembly protein PilY1
MKRTLVNRPTARHMLGFALAATLALPLPSLAAPVSLASEPLTTTTASNVKPNVMFILDDSGTMKYNYLPDWANDSYPGTGTSYTSMPELFTNSGFNGLAYNPAVTYKPPVYYKTDGTLDDTTYPSYSTYGAVKNDGYSVLDATGTSNLVGNASYYTFVTGEYCSTVKKDVCTPSTVPTGIYQIPAGLRWCNSAALTNCQSINSTTYKYPRYPKPATATVTVTASSSSPLETVTQIAVNSQLIMNAAAAGSNFTSTTATNIRNAINACTAASVGFCTVAGYSATVSGSTVKITAPDGSGAITYTPVVSGSATTTKTAFAGGVPGYNVHTNVVLPTTTTYAYPGTSSKAPTRSDCNTGTTCTYAQEMTNYANWWAYYHTRTQAMKTSVSRAFKALNANYRVGFSTLCNTDATTGTGFLENDTFENAGASATPPHHKTDWFDKLFSTGIGCYTPLRGALSKIGRYYAHVVGAVDPVQYSCQQNFAILSTDGYWNTGGTSPGKEIASTYGPIGLTGANVGDLDNVVPTSYPSDGMYQGPTAYSNTLADVAKYYYDTDLRSSDLGNCAGGISPDFLSGNPNVCPNNVFTSATDTQVQQHMTTFTMGLGADGVLNYQSDYATASYGDFYSIKNGLGVNWPKPVADTPTAIDDLWHAAVNGHGAYFSAKDPDQIITGFTSALSSITAKLGSAAAAATSTLNPVAGNNYAYLASYTTVKWTGNLEARSININTGAVSDTATWCVENIIADTCAPPATIVPVLNGSSTIYNCVVPNATPATCSDPGSVYNPSASPSPTCTTEIANKCVGSMTRPPTVSPKVSTASDNRAIYTANNAGNALIPFDSAYATAHTAYFDARRCTLPVGYHFCGAYTRKIAQLFARSDGLRDEFL